jgi:predicted anti-sigma-YlaC factor YlaD
MKCRQLLKHLSDYLDRDIDPAICRHIESHMKDCKPCIAFVKTLKKSIGVLNRQPPAVPSEKLRAALRRRLTR